MVKLALVGETETETFCGADVIVTLALADLVVSAAQRALTVTALEGAVAGAVNMPDALIVPVLELPPCTPLTSQLTAVFVVPVTLDVNCCVMPVCNVALAGEMVMPMGEVGLVVGVDVPTVA